MPIARSRFVLAGALAVLAAAAHRQGAGPTTLAAVAGRAAVLRVAGFPRLELRHRDGVERLELIGPVLLVAVFAMPSRLAVLAALAAALLEGLRWVPPPRAAFTVARWAGAAGARQPDLRRPPRGLLAGPAEPAGAVGREAGGGRRRWPAVLAGRPPRRPGGGWLGVGWFRGGERRGGWVPGGSGAAGSRVGAFGGRWGPRLAVAPGRAFGLGLGLGLGLVFVAAWGGRRWSRRCSWCRWRWCTGARACMGRCGPITGYRADEVIGTRGLSRLRPRDLAGQEVRLERRTASAESPPTILEVLNPTGERCWISCSYARVPANGGPPRRLVLTSRDVTKELEPQRAEQALRERAARFQALVQNSSHMVVVLDAGGGITYASPAFRRMLGHRDRSQVGLGLFDPVHPDDLQAPRARFSEHLAGAGQTASYEFRCLAGDGTWPHLEALASNLLEDPAVRGVVFNTRDVSERNHAEGLLAGQAAVLDLIARDAP